MPSGKPGLRAFTSSKSYRDLKLRSAILHGDKQLKVLPKEEIVSTIHGVWNLSSDQASFTSQWTLSGNYFISMCNFGNPIITTYILTYVDTYIFHRDDNFILINR
jgi:hypothetical protein